MPAHKGKVRSECSDRGGGRKGTSAAVKKLHFYCEDAFTEIYKEIQRYRSRTKSNFKKDPAVH